MSYQPKTSLTRHQIIGALYLTAALAVASYTVTGAAVHKPATFQERWPTQNLPQLDYSSCTHHWTYRMCDWTARKCIVV